MKWSAFILTCVIILVSHTCTAQGWSIIQSTPFFGYRYDDVSFSSVDSGLITNQTGYVLLTPDGGTTWDTVFHQSTFFGRSLGMLNSNIFMVGQYGSVGGPLPTDTNIILMSFNKGQSWNPVSTFSGPTPAGICGISVVNDSVAMGVGRFDGPAVFIKTMDGGATFHSMDMTIFSTGLVDCHFFSPDTGFAVGRSPNSTFTTSMPVILYTTDGGNNWQTVYTGSVMSRWCWKISFPGRQVGYVSVENNPMVLGALDTNYVIKTTDGGLSWQLLPVDLGTSRLQGIGFINDSTGWVGETVVRKTVNGGVTWTLTNELPYFNRMRKFDDSTFVAVGSRLNKYDFLTSDFINIPAKESGITNLKGNPNPTDKNILISYELKTSTPLIVYLYTQAGVLINKFEIPEAGSGKKSFDLDVQKFKSGMYFLVLNSDIGSNSLELIKY